LKQVELDQTHCAGSSNHLGFVREWGRFAAILVLLALPLSTDHFRNALAWPAELGMARQGILDSFEWATNQKLFVLVLAAYAFWFAFIIRSLPRESLRGRMVCAPIWNLRAAPMIGFCATALAWCWPGQAKVEWFGDVVVLFYGIALAHGLLLWKLSRGDIEPQEAFARQIVNALILCLTISVLVQPAWREEFSYHGQRRWQGPWWNPNHFGLLMATGIVLALGSAWERRQGRALTRNLWLRRATYVLTAALMGYGLAKSYSRGSWLGAALGLAYLGGYALRQEMAGGFLQKRALGTKSWFRGRRVALLLILFSISVMWYWGCEHRGSTFLQRAFSVLNTKDFSWRNRLAAYDGALQMMAARPWLGFGWSQPKDVFDQFFKPARMVDPRAIQLNDCFTVGTTLGVPALVCFVVYVGFAFLPRRDRADKHQDDWTATICRAAVVVFLTGFWFDRGLFFAALGVPFWVLLELATVLPTEAQER
jgi:O-Antigen ligase